MSFLFVHLINVGLQQVVRHFAFRYFCGQ